MKLLGNVEDVNSTFTILYSLGLRLGFGQADGALTFFPLASLLEQLDTLEALENRTLAAGAAGYLE